MVDDKEDDDFMCMRVGSEKAIATYKGVTVVASKCKANPAQVNELLQKKLNW